MFLVCGLLSTGLVTITVAQAPSPPSLNEYWPECWRGDDLLYGYQEKSPSSGLLAFTYIDQNERGYPMHSSRIVGVSDTAVISVRFEKRQGGSYNIASANPETWFTPILYALGADRRKMPPIADASNFQYQFLYWTDGNRRVTKPTAIPPLLSGNKVYYLIYKVWGIPQGRYLLTMKTTTYAPTDLKLCMHADLPLWIAEAVDQQDTISALMGCFWRAIGAGNLTLAVSWTDTILVRNPKSIVGYRAKALALQLQGQPTACLTALDSTIAITARYGDPVLPDSANLNNWQTKWYFEFQTEAKWTRWCVANNEFPGYR